MTNESTESEPESERRAAEPVGAEELDEALFRRVVLANQYEMLASLRPEGADLYLDIAERLRDWWPIEDMYPIDQMREMRGDPLTREDQDFVKDVLEMFDALQRADGEGLVGEADKRAVRFMGFCGNYELKYLSYLDWLRGQDMFLYVTLANPTDTNSHFPMIEIYRRMLGAWEALGRPRTLGAEDVAALLRARISPEKRQPAETAA
ncbi:MAG TPA: YfbU family protein [Allosphingosinicella sp.]|nr:YfbU family protein [Allosphingosinicella sp.]